MSTNITPPTNIMKCGQCDTGRCSHCTGGVCKCPCGGAGSIVQELSKAQDKERDAKERDVKERDAKERKSQSQQLTTKQIADNTGVTMGNQRNFFLDNYVPSSTSLVEYCPRIPYLNPGEAIEFEYKFPDKLHVVLSLNGIPMIIDPTAPNAPRERLIATYEVIVVKRTHVITEIVEESVPFNLITEPL